MTQKKFDQKRLAQAMEILNDLEQTCIQNWKNESGADLADDRGISGNSHLKPERLLTEHIERAQKFIADDKYDLACLEMQTAAERFSTYKQMIKQSLDTSIASMSTQGTSSCAPHPKTLEMIKLRDRL